MKLEDLLPEEPTYSDIEAVLRDSSMNMAEATRAVRDQHKEEVKSALLMALDDYEMAPSEHEENLLDVLRYIVMNWGEK